MTPAASGKKRPASSDHDDDSDDDSMDNNTSFFSRIVSSVTPWKRKNKRARSSLDSMSGSAIKSASRLPTSEDSDRSSNGNGGGAGKALEKLNLEHKFHEAPAAAAPKAVPVQTLNGQQTAITNNEGNAAKRVRIAESAPPTTAANGTSNGDEGAVKAIRIGGTTFVSSTAKSTTNGQSVTFQDATMPRFNIGSTTTKLKDVRGRNATPARGRGDRSKWGTPSAKAARFGSKNNTLPQDGLMTNGTSGIAANKGGFQRRSIGNLSTTSRGGAYRRRAINARTYKPMANLLSRIHTEHATGRNGAAATGQSKQQSLFLSNSIADQILRDTQNKLFQSTASGVSGNYQETALFGVAPSDINNGARTFQEEEAQYKAVTKKGSAVPRVRMNRVLGSGQIGGRAQLESDPSTAATTAKTFGTGAVPAIAAAAATAGSGMTASVSLKPSIIDKSIVPAATSFAAPSAPPSIAAAPETKAKAVVAFAPFKSKPIPARDAGKTQFLPCDDDENLSQKMGDEISQLASTEAFRRKAAQNNPFVNVSEATKTPKKKKSKGTPHPKKAGGSGTKPISEAAGGTPFNFMPGGGAASAKVDTPLAFSYGKKTEVPQSSTPAVSKTPAKSKPVAPAAADASTSETKTTASEGWGNIFASQKKQWRCPVCTTQNPLDENVCLSCEAPREGTASKSNATSSGGKNDSDKKATASTGGFTFGAPSSTTKASAGSIGAGGFSFGSASSSTASTSAPAIKFGATPSKAKEQKEKDDSKPSASAGFSFGTATPAKTKPSSGGFSFGVTPATTSSKAESSDDKNEDTSKGTVGFSFGAPASSSSTTSNATFSFGQNSASSGADENKGDTANTGAFKFVSSSSDPKPKRGRGEDEENRGGGKKKASAGTGFSFGSNATENKSTPTTSFGFGAATKKEEAPAAPAATFAFGGTPSEKKSDNAASSFAFGSATTDVKEKSDTAPADAPGFSFGQSSASTGATSINAQKKEPSFKFGQAASEKKDNSVATPAPAFAFGAAAPAAAAKASAPAAAFQFGSQAPAAAPPVAVAPPAASLFGGSGFGMAQSAPPQPAAQVPAPAPAFGFGAASQTPAPAPAFGFGGSAQPAAPAANTGFAFGSNPTTAPAPPPAFGMPLAAPPVATPVPAFGMQSAPTPAPTGFGGGGFGGTQAPAPAMNSGAASGGFNIGTGGGAKKTPGGRRIVRARRPPGSGR